MCEFTSSCPSPNGFVNSNVSNDGDVSVTGLTCVSEGLIADAAGRLFAIAQYRAGCCQSASTGAIYEAGAATPWQHLRDLSGFAHTFDSLRNHFPVALAFEGLAGSTSQTPGPTLASKWKYVSG
jgi:hypothetical protein